MCELAERMNGGSGAMRKRTRLEKGALEHGDFEKIMNGVFLYCIECVLNKLVF